MGSSKNMEAEGKDGHNNSSQIRDIEWLASLSEPELDFLISLKELAIIRAKNIGHNKLAEKFDISILRAIGYILLEYLKERLQNVAPTADVKEILAMLNCSRLVNLTCDDSPNISTATTNSLAKSASFISAKRKRMWDGLREASDSASKKLKTEDTEM